MGFPFISFVFIRSNLRKSVAIGMAGVLKQSLAKNLNDPSHPGMATDARDRLE
jgi:hypothetical protein